MQLILAIDSDPRRSEQLAALVRTAKLSVDLVQATSAGEGLHALRDRVPDLILTSPLLSPFDDGVLDEYLRDLGSAAAHVQTVRIPMLSAVSKKKSSARSLFGLGRKKATTSSAAPDGCDPKIFADEITHYLTRSAEQRAAANKQAPVQAPEESVILAYAPADELVPESLIEEFSEVPEPIDDVASTVDNDPVIDPEPIIDLEPIIDPEPVIDPEPIIEPAAVIEAEPLVVEPVAATQPAVVKPADAPATNTSSSFEAALAAIRAAWVKPEDKEDKKDQASNGSGDTKRRPEKSRGLQTGPDGRDEWGVFDPNQCGFSALVNKLDEVTDDDVPVRTDVNAR